MPEPSDPLSERLAAAPGLPTLLAEARATWLARAESDADATAEAIADRDADAAGGDPLAAATGAATHRHRRHDRRAGPLELRAAAEHAAVAGLRRRVSDVLPVHEPAPQLAAPVRRTAPSASSPVAALRVDSVARAVSACPPRGRPVSW